MLIWRINRWLKTRLLSCTNNAFQNIFKKQLKDELQTCETGDSVLRLCLFILSGATSAFKLWGLAFWYEDLIPNERNCTPVGRRKKHFVLFGATYGEKLQVYYLVG